MPTQQRNNDGKDGQHRLTDIQVEEVSFVDRGANKKRFLIVKREGGQMKGGELVPDGRGGMKRVSKSDKGGEKDEEDADKAKPKSPPFGGNKAPPFKPKKPKGEEDEEDDEETDKAAGDEDDEEETDKAAGDEDDDDDEEEDDEETDKAAGDEDDDEEETQKGSVRKGMLASVTQAIELLMECAEELKEGDGDDPPSSVVTNAKKVVGLLGKMLGADTAKAALAKGLGVTVEKLFKAGRRMSKERMDRFQKALSDLNSILKEVMASPELKDDTEKRGPVLLKALSKIGKSFAGAGGDNAQVDRLLGALEELTEHTQQLEADNQRLRKRNELLRKGGGTSNALGVDTREDGALRGDGVEWPMDLNSPIDRAHTQKDMSFYDEEES